jgi:uncharacterized protein YjiS (DUF1127 family)
MSTLLQERHQPITAPKLRDRVPAQFVTPQASARHEAAAAVPDRSVEALRERWRLILGSIVATLREWCRRSVDRSELAGLDERTLRDIGLDRGVVNYEVYQPFWRAPRDWRDWSER